MKNKPKNLNELVEYIEHSVSIVKTAPHLHRYVVDGIRNNIFYMTQTKEFFSGYYSKDAFEQVFDTGNHNNLCKEHHYGLKGLAERIIEMNLSKDVMKQFIKDNASYHYTTKEENIRLKLNKQSYKKCKIELNTYMEWVHFKLNNLETQEDPISQYLKIKIKTKYKEIDTIQHSWWG